MRTTIAVLGSLQGILIIMSVVVVAKDKPLYYGVLTLGTLLLVTIAYEVIRAPKAGRNVVEDIERGE